MESELERISEWVSLQLAKGYAPRLSEVLDYAYKELGLMHLKRSQIARTLRLHKSYVMTSSQQREAKRAGKFRSIITNTLGQLHADIAYIGLSKDYETPKTYQAGILIAIDILSKYKYAVIIRKNKSAPQMVKAFKELLDQHRQQFPNGHLIKSISFDQETSVMGKLVQSFLKDNNITFHSFAFTSSKAKLAENSIRYFRNAIKRLMIDDPSRRWWTILDNVVKYLNEQPIRIKNKSFSWRPIDINQSNLNEYLDNLYKANPVQYHTQFSLASELAQFKYNLDSLVRVKKIATSSNVLEKRSEISLEPALFKIVERIAYLTKATTVGKAYRCINVQSREEEIFDESEIVETTILK